MGLSGVLDGQLDKLPSQSLILLSPVDGVAQVVGARPGDPFGVALALPPHLVFKAGPQSLVGIGPGPESGLEGDASGDLRGGCA